MNLFKKVVLAAFLIAISSGAFAQAQFSVGLKGGLNFANLDVTSVSNTYNNRTGYHAGAFALLKFAKIGVQPELIFSQQGSTVKVNGDDVKSNFSYMNIPIMIKLYTVAGINLQAGPQFGFLMNDPVVVNNNQEIEGAVKKSDISLSMGLGWDLPFGLTIDGRYNLGLQNVSDNSSFDIKNQVFQVSVGFKLIKLGGK
ncbi:MAG: porin family protein [Chryseolinea sp.]